MPTLLSTPSKSLLETALKGQNAKKVFARIKFALTKLPPLKVHPLSLSLAI